VSNITTALSSLIERKPQLVIQTRKSGNSKQARKRYRLTDAGIRAVERMISGGEM
jgi:DNA-binding PadR family transcriptional regulator